MPPWNGSVLGKSAKGARGRRSECERRFDFSTGVGPGLGRQGALGFSIACQVRLRTSPMTLR
jgi:hypothetical protein